MQGYGPSLRGVPVLCVERPGVGKALHPLAPSEDPLVACRAVWRLASVMGDTAGTVWYVIPPAEG